MENRDIDFTFELLPAEILMHIFSSLELKDITNVILISKLFNDLIVNNNVFWKNKFTEHFSGLKPYEEGENKNWYNIFRKAMEMKDSHGAYKTEFKNFTDKEKTFILLKKLNDVATIQKKLTRADLNNDDPRAAFNSTFLYSFLKNASQELNDAVYGLLWKAYFRGKLNAQDDLERGFLHWLAITNKSDELQSYVNLVKKMEQKPDAFNNTPLDYAIIFSHPEIVKIAFPEKQKERDDVFLSAIEKNSVVIAQEIIAFASDKAKTTALNQKIGLNKEMMELLLTNNARPSDDFLKSLMQASQRANNTETLEAFILHPNTKKKTIETMLKFAMNDNNLTAMTEIINQTRLQKYIYQKTALVEKHQSAKESKQELKTGSFFKQKFTISDQIKAGKQLLKVMRGQADATSLNPHIMDVVKHSKSLTEIYDFYQKSKQPNLALK